MIRHAVLLLFAVALSGCAMPAPAPPWIETRLFFGLSPADRPVDEARWRGFLDREVTPRFPNGFSVLDGYGQWQGAGETAPERLRSRILLVERADDAAGREHSICVTPIHEVKSSGRY